MKLQKARKNHICDECQRKILKGEVDWRPDDVDAERDILFEAMITTTY